MSLADSRIAIPAIAPSGDRLDLLVASTARSRMVGLLGQRGLAPDRALVIEPCGSVHTAGMRFSIDVVFVRWRERDRQIEVLAGHHCVRPWRLASFRRRGTGLRRREVAAVELACGRASALGLAAGAVLELT